MKTLFIAAAAWSFSILASAHADDSQSARVRHVDLNLKSDSVCRDTDSRGWLFTDLKPRMAQDLTADADCSRRVDDIRFAGN
jgi:hypothetical protein